MDVVSALAAMKSANLHRQRKTAATAPERTVVIDGKEMLLFSSNSYLGLSTLPAIVHAAKEAMDIYGTGAGGSRLTTGNMEPHMRLEKQLAAFKGAQASLVFSSGYMANIGALTALSDSESVIFSDALNHASIVDGCRLSKARVVIYAHNDPDDLVAKICEARPKKGIIVTDGVFSMDGDIAKLPELVRIKAEHKLLLMVDDAHATGVMGASGRGSPEHFGLENKAVDIVMGTLSKAIPGEGGFICGSEELCDYLRNSARSFIYTTALSPAIAAATTAAVEYIQKHPERVQRLQENMRYFSNCLEGLGIHATSSTPIFPVIIGEEGKALRISGKLQELGVFVPCIRYPSVAKGEARLRFTVMASHTRDDMEYAASCLKLTLAHRA